MIRTRATMIEQEAANLAPYAQKSGDSAGRRHPEPPHSFRTEYQRDYARIIHSRAFRRLEYKTQVFLNGTGDHLRTRLTHTMEVVSITRCIARALGLNEDLAEAIALAHDLGHAPFGHSGEGALNEKMQGHGGFDHNEQSLRLVELIEKKYPHFEGLNLSFELLEGLQKHREIYLPPPGSNALCYLNPSLEAQVANLADEIAYYSHDLDDGLDFHLIHPAQLSELDIWREFYDEVKRRFPLIEGRELHAYVIRCIIDREVEDVIVTSSARIAASGVCNVEQVRRQPGPLIGYSERLAQANQALRTFLYAHLYHHPDVAQVNRRACEMLGRVFDAYMAHPNLLGSTTSARVEVDGLHRAVCDYLSGMTDRYLLDEYARLFPASVS